MNKTDFTAALSEDLRRRGVSFREAEVETFAGRQWAQMTNAPDAMLAQQIADASLAYIREFQKRKRARFALFYGLGLAALGGAFWLVAAAIGAGYLTVSLWGGTPADFDCLTAVYEITARMGPSFVLAGAIGVVYGAVVLGLSYLRSLVGGRRSG